MFYVSPTVRDRDPSESRGSPGRPMTSGASIHKAAYVGYQLAVAGAAGRPPVPEIGATTTRKRLRGSTGVDSEIDTAARSLQAASSRGRQIAGSESSDQAFRRSVGDRPTLARLSQALTLVVTRSCPAHEWVLYGLKSLWRRSARRIATE